MGIFKNITKKIKEFAPTIGSAIGMFYGGPLGASIGSGIGSLVAGRSAEEALRNAALTGATTYAMGGKDFGKGFKFDTSGSPFASPKTLGPGEFADTNAITAVKSADTGSVLSKLIPESTMGKIALAGGIGALAGGFEEEPMTGGFKERPYPKGKPRLGVGMVDGISFDLNDDEERAEYFRRVREKQGFKDKEDEDEDEISTDPVRAYRGGFFPRPGMQQQMGDTGLNRFGAQISEKIVAPSQEKVREVPAFLDEIKSMAEERFDVQLNGTNQTGGGLNQMGARLPSFNQNIANLFEQMKNRVGQDNTTQNQEFSAQPAVIRQAPLMGFGGSPIGSSSPFGGGQSRTIGGLGSIAGLLKMNQGGIYDIGGVSGVGGDMLEMDRIIPDPNDTRTDVEKMSTGKLKYRTLAGKEGLTEAQLREVQEEYAKRIAPKASMMPMASVGDPSQLMRNFMVGGEVRGPGTGTSDSVPARLSDGEFVLTAKAIRGAGGGDRDLGAARMYDMMSQLERIA